MKKLNLMALAMLAAAVTVSCSKDEVTEVSPSQVIGFKAMTDKPVERAGINQTSDLKSFRVFGCITANNNATQNHVMIFNNDRVYIPANGTTWTYDNKQYWSENKDYYFVAFSTNVMDTKWTFTAPTSHPASLSTTGFTGYGELKFKMSDTGDRDLIYASATKVTGATIGADIGKVDFTFEHLLSRIGVKLTNNVANMYSLRIENIKIGNAIQAATIADMGNISWSEDDPTKKQIISFPNMDKDDYIGYNAEHNTLSFNDGARFIIPGTQELTISFDVLVYANSAATGSSEKVLVDSHTLEGTLPNMTFTKGNSYLFTAKITADNIMPGGAKPIEFNVSNVASWNTTSPDEDITINTPTPSN